MRKRQRGDLERPRGGDLGREVVALVEAPPVDVAAGGAGVEIRLITVDQHLAERRDRGEGQARLGARDLSGEGVFHGLALDHRDAAVRQLGGCDRALRSVELGGESAQRAPLEVDLERDRGGELGMHAAGAVARELGPPLDGLRQDAAVGRRCRHRSAARGDARGEDACSRTVGELPLVDDLAVREPDNLDHAARFDECRVGLMLVDRQRLDLLLYLDSGTDRDLRRPHERQDLEQDEEEDSEDAGDDRHAAGGDYPTRRPVDEEPPGRSASRGSSLGAPRRGMPLVGSRGRREVGVGNGHGWGGRGAGWKSADPATDRLDPPPPDPEFPAVTEASPAPRRQSCRGSGGSHP